MVEGVRDVDEQHGAAGKTLRAHAGLRNGTFGAIFPQAGGHLNKLDPSDGDGWQAVGRRSRTGSRQRWFDR